MKIDGVNILWVSKWEDPGALVISSGSGRFGVNNVQHIVTKIL